MANTNFIDVTGLGVFKEEYIDSNFIAGNAEQQLSDAQQVQAQNNMMAKSYVPAQFSGLGKRMLAKNIQQVSGVNKNVMTQAFFEDGQGNLLTNTVFVIQYDYTLGNDIEIGAGCTLLFDGGSIDLGQYTMSGTLINDELNVTDFSKDNDITKGLQCCVNLCGSVFIPKGSYTISSTINVGSNKYIYGKETVITTDSIINAFNLDGDNIKIEGLNFVGKTILGTDNPSYLVYARKSHSGLEICNCSFSKCTGGIYVESDYDFIKLHDNKITETVYHPSLGAGGYGIVLDNPDAGETTYFDNAEIYSNYVDAIRHCIYVQVGHNCSIHNNTFIMDDARRSSDYDTAIMDGGVENIQIYDNVQNGGNSFYVFSNYARGMLIGLMNINISNNKMSGLTTRSFGAIHFESYNTNFNVSVLNNFIEVSYAYIGAIILTHGIVDGFNLADNRLKVIAADNANPHAVFFPQTEGISNLRIINNTIESIGGQYSYGVLTTWGKEHNSLIKNILLCNNYIKGGYSAFSIQDCYNISGITIKANICEGQAYTPLYFDGNIGTTENIICTDNLLYIYPQSGSDIGIDLKVTQDKASVIANNIEIR